MKKTNLLLLGIMVMLAVSLRAQNTTYNNPGNTIIISNDIAFTGNVYITPQTTVVINAGVEVLMSPSTTIYVDKGGARLIVKGRITSNPQNITGTMWRGIEVLGDNGSSLPNLNTIVGVSQQTPINSTHGLLILEGAEITGSLLGVLVKDRGMLYCKNSTFDYCNRSISIQSLSGQANVISPNITRIENTTFINRSLNLGGIAQVSAIYTYGITLADCNFTTIGQSKEGMAISAYESNIKIYNSIFNNLHTPISIQSAGIAMGSQIKGCTFESNRRGLVIIGSNHSVITGNSFFTNSAEMFNSGTELDGSFGFILQNNSYTGYHIGFYNKIISALRITNSGVFGNVVNNNTFNNNLTGVSAIHNNRGLQIKCNDFNVTPSTIPDGDIYVYSTPQFNINNVGIPNQGVQIANDQTGYFLPNNKFSQNCFLAENNFGDINTNDYVPNFDYITFQNAPNSLFTPQCFPITNVRLRESMVNQTNRTSSCALYNSNRYNVQEIMSDITIKQNLIQTLYQSESIDFIGIQYLKESINSDMGAVAALYLDVDFEGLSGLSAILNESTSVYNQMLYVQYLIYTDSLDKASQTLYSITDTTNIHDVTIFKQYYARLIELLIAGADLKDLSNEDIDLFQTIAESATSTAAKAQVLLNAQSINNLSPYTSTPNLVEDSKIEIFPNPAKSHLSVLNVSLTTTYKIHDIKMRLIAEGNFNLSNQINTGTFDNGLYFITLTSDEKTEVIRFVVQK
jgi:hypothetical protein